MLRVKCLALVCILVTVGLTACGASNENAVATSVALTVEASPTETLVPPTDTPEPTPTSEPTATPEPTAIPLSDFFISNIQSFLTDGSALNAATDTGINYINYNRQFADLRGVYELALSDWPDGFAIDARDKFDHAIEAWDWTLFLWQLKLDEKDNPVEPDINGYLQIVDFAGEENLVIDTHPQNFIVTSYRNKQFLPFDENISILLSIASEDFEAGRALMLDALP